MPSVTIQRKPTPYGDTETLPQECAGRLMVTEVPVVNPNATAGQTTNLLLREAKNFRTINYIYATDDRGKLIGVLSVEELLGLPKTHRIADAMEKKIVSVRPHTDQERVALLAINHNIKAVPVVDAEDHFLGIVPSDTILNVLHQESIEDALRSSGIHKFRDSAHGLLVATAGVYFRKRLPWLIVGLFGGLLAAFVVGAFEHVLSKMLVLAAFIPSVVYIADAVGTQTATIFIRSMAIDHTLDLKTYVSREIKVSASLAVVLGFIASLFSWLWWNSILLGIILGVSFFTTIAAAAATAVFLPWLFNKFKYDPAIASGPLATVIRDILSVVIYFAVAQAAMAIAEVLS